MADQANNPANNSAYDDSIDPIDADGVPAARGSDRTLLSLRAVNSADRLLRTLSPWIRESLTGEVSPRTSGSLIRRLMQKRRVASFTFNGTVGIMRRFNRIVNRSVSWQANVGPIDPNLFDRFSLDMTRRRDIGANNIAELLKLNRQEDGLDMPLAGAPESTPSAQPNPEPARPLSLEEITKKIEAARLLRSQSPSSQPDYVQAMRKQQEAAPTPPANPSPSTLRPPQRPSGAPPTPPSSLPTPPLPAQPSAADQPNPAAMSPRTRRRMGRKVEYISMPNMEEDNADGDPSPIRQFALGPPGAPLWPSTPAPDFGFSAIDDDPPGDDSLIVNVMRKPAPRRSRVAAARPRPAQRPIIRPGRATPSVPQAPARHRRPSMIARSVAHLSQSTSGEILASRPHSLLAHLARTPNFTPSPTAHPPLWSGVAQSSATVAPVAQSPNRPIASEGFTGERSNWTSPRQHMAEPSLPLLLARPLHPLPTIAVRRTDAPAPSPVPGFETDPIAASTQPATRRSRRAASAAAHLAAARQPTQRLVAKPVAPLSSTPLSSTPTLPPPARLPLDEIRHRAARPRRAAWQDDTPAHLAETGPAHSFDDQLVMQSVEARPSTTPWATPALITVAQPTVRRTSLVPVTNLWQPMPLDDAPSFTAADTRLARAVRLPTESDAASPSLWRNSVDIASVLTPAGAVSPRSPLTPSPVANWMPLEYTAQRLLGGSVPAQSSTTESSVLPTAPARVAPRPVRATPQQAPVQRHPGQRSAAPATLLESIVRRDFARSRAAVLADGVLPLPIATDAALSLPRTSPAPDDTTVQQAQPTRTAPLSAFASAGDVAAPPSPQSVSIARPTPEPTSQATPQPSPQPPTAVPQPRPTDPARAIPEARTALAAPHELPTLPASAADRRTAPAAPVVQARRTAILSQTLRRLAHIASPTVRPPRHEQRWALQRSGERVRPAYVAMSPVQPNLRPGLTALASLSLSQSASAVQRLPSQAHVWTVSADPAQTVSAMWDAAERALPAAAWQDASPLSSSDPIDMLVPAPVQRNPAMPVVQRQAAFVPLELALRQLNRAFAPDASTPNVQPTTYASPPAPTIERRIAQTSVRPRPVVARPASAADTATYDTAHLRAAPLRRPDGGDRATPSIRPAAAQRSSAQMPVTASAEQTPEQPPASPLPLVDQILARDFGQLRRSGLGRRIDAAHPTQPPSPAADSPALSPHHLAVTEVTIPPARRQRRAHAPRSWRTRREWTHQLRRDLLPDLLASTEQPSQSSNRPIAQSRRRRFSVQAEEIQSQSSVAVDRSPITLSSVGVEGRPLAFPHWLTPPVSAAWPAPEDNPGAAFGAEKRLPSVQRSLLDPASPIAHSQPRGLEPLPQAPFARHFWLRSTQTAPPTSAQAISAGLEPLLGAAPFLQRTTVPPQARPLAARAIQSNVVNVPALLPELSSRMDREEPARIGGEPARSLPAAQTPDARLPLRRLRAVTTLIQPSPAASPLEQVSAVRPTSTQTPSVQRSTERASTERALTERALTERTPTDGIAMQTTAQMPASAQLTAETPVRSSLVQRKGALAESAPPSSLADVRRLTPSRRHSSVRSLVEGVVARSFGNSRRRMLSSGPLPLPMADASSSLLPAMDETFVGDEVVNLFASSAQPRPVLSAPVAAGNIARLTDTIVTPPAPDLPALTQSRAESSAGAGLQFPTQAAPLPPLVLRQLPPLAASTTETTTQAATSSPTLPIASRSSSTQTLSSSSTVQKSTQRLPIAQTATTAPTSQRSVVQRRSARLTQTLLDLSAAELAAEMVAQPELHIGLPRPQSSAQRRMLGVPTAQIDVSRSVTDSAAPPSSVAPSRPQARLRPGTVARQVAVQARVRRSAAQVEPVSMAWRAALLRDVADPQDAAAILSTRPPDVTPGRAEGGADVDAQTLWRSLPSPSTQRSETTSGWRPPTQAAHFVPLELALQRLLIDRPAQSAATPAADVAPSVTGERVLQRMEAGGWRFKRQERPPAQDVAAAAQSVQRLTQAAAARPLPAAPRTLLERVLQRDFAGVRVQTASLGALGVEAAAKDDTVYLSPAAARLDSAQSLALLGHELTHVAARLPLKVQRQPAELPPELPPALPLAAPSLTRQLSQRLVQMSLAQEESTAALVESTVRRAAQRRPAALKDRPLATARLAQRKIDGRRFTPSTALWSGDGAPLLPPESALPSSLLMSQIERGSSGLGRSEQIASSAIRLNQPNPLNPRSIQRTAADLPLSQPDRADRAVTHAHVLESMQSEGWRFKRTGNGAAQGDVQAATQTARSLAAGRAMPLPVQPRSLLERVLQRDFSGVRMQVAGLEPLGVEAAARGNTVVVQRETATNLHRPENLALLGHELTHVAAAGHAPVQRTPLTSSAASYAQGAIETPLVQRTLSPALPATRGSVAAEERIADQVEAGIRRMPEVQRVALAPNPSSATPTSPLNLPLSPLKRARMGTAAQPAPAVPSPLDVQRSPSATLSAELSAEFSATTPAVIQRKVEGERSALSGVERTSMPVAQRYHVPVRRSSAEDDPGANGSVTETAQPVTATPPTFGEKITITAPRVQRDPDQAANASNDPDENNEPDWAQLAEKIYPLLKDRLLAERDRLGW